MLRDPPPDLTLCLKSSCGSIRPSNPRIEAMHSFTDTHQSSLLLYDSSNCSDLHPRVAKINQHQQIDTKTAFIKPSIVTNGHSSQASINTADKSFKTSLFPPHSITPFHSTAVHLQPLKHTLGNLPSIPSTDTINNNKMSWVTDASALEKTVYSRRSCKLVHLINDLRDAGAHIELSLPTLVVCGNQSVGKSSLVEAICGITLPKAAGTCTRCVTEVRLSEYSDVGPVDSVRKKSVAGDRNSTESTITQGVYIDALDTVSSGSVPSAFHIDGHEKESSTWSCTITLRFEYDEAGIPLRSIREVLFGPPLVEKSLVALAVRRAQKALLNPTLDPSVFLTHIFTDNDQSNSDTKSNQLKFTKNIVCLDIQGAGINLALVDLPGIIRNVEHPDDAMFIPMIEDLVKSYIQKERTIIVATITCKDEMENQAIVHLAREVDPTGIRTIGVLTKPDTIESGTAARWADILMGNLYPLKLGYFMVRCLSKAELAAGNTLQDAQKLENAFFAQSQPWSTLRRKSARFGAPALRFELSRLLINLVDMSLPQIKSLTETAIEDAIAELGSIPPALGENARIELFQMIRHYCTLVTFNINAQHDFKLFYQKVRKCFEGLRDQIVDTRPRFDLEKKGYSATVAPGNFTDSFKPDVNDPPLNVSNISKQDTSSPKKSTPGASFSLASSFSMVIPSMFVSNSNHTMSSDSIKASTAKANDSGSNPYTQFHPPSLNSTPTSWNTSVAEACKLNMRRALTLADLQRVVDAQKGRELQGYSPYGAFTFLIAACQEEWKRYAIECLTNVANELAQLLLDLTEQVFGRFANLQAQLRLFTQMFLNELQRVSMEQIHHVIEMEMRHPFTLSSRVFVDRKARYIKILNGSVDSTASTPITPSTSSIEDTFRASSIFAQDGFFHLSIAGKLKSYHSTDISILDLMASTLAYMEIAIGRVCDTIPMTIEHHFLARFGDMLEKELVSQLGVLDGDAEGIEVLLREDWGVAERRADVEAKKDRLESVWRSLHNFGI
ncbi:hypothetical protein O5D80_008660 [Batrachochytrium dendrobatidis]|nr:hypothetical protein O5D80_008660 [Batrachochytrium dendrobatidis]